jgi:hypothetical protein
MEYYSHPARSCEKNLFVYGTDDKFKKLILGSMQLQAASYVCTFFLIFSHLLFLIITISVVKQSISAICDKNVRAWVSIRPSLNGFISKKLN